MKIDLTFVLEAAFTLLSALLAAFVLPVLKKRLTAEQTETLRTWVRIGVAAAEQLYGSEAGQKKKDYVLSFLLGKGLVVDVDEVTALLESEVYRLSQSAADSR